MRNLIFLVPVLVACGLIAFVATRLFDASSAGVAAPPDVAVEPVAAPAVSAPRSARTPAPTASPAPSPASPSATTEERAADPASRLRAEVEGRLRDSGATREAWAREASVAVDQVLRAPELQAVLRNAPAVECFADGCMAKLVFANQSDFDLHQPTLGEAGALGAWSRVVTGPERQPDGSVQNALVVFRPPSPEELAAIETKRAELGASRP